MEYFSSSRQQNFQIAKKSFSIMPKVHFKQQNSINRIEKKTAAKFKQPLKCTKIFKKYLMLLFVQFFLTSKSIFIRKSIKIFFIPIIIRIIKRIFRSKFRFPHFSFSFSFFFIFYAQSKPPLHIFRRTFGFSPRSHFLIFGKSGNQKYLKIH